jgi:succinate dehydrogenase / fumarate reductase membrane anchor subunit
MNWQAIHWYLQRITGAALLLLLIMHFWVEHFLAGPVREGKMTFEVIHARISNPWMQAIDISFLLIALYHGLIGLRNIILDYSRVPAKLRPAISVVLVIVGVAWAYWGITAFYGNPHVRTVEANVAAAR